PPSGHSCQRTARPFLCTSTPPPAPAWLGTAGGTATTGLPAAAAVTDRRRKHALPPAARLRLARGGVLSRVAVGRASGESVAAARRRRLVRAVCSCPAHPLGCAGAVVDGLAPALALAPLLAAGDTPRCAREGPCGQPVAARMGEGLPAGPRGNALQAQVTAR